jgi:hypothetical protein
VEDLARCATPPRTASPLVRRPAPRPALRPGLRLLHDASGGLVLADGDRLQPLAGTAGALLRRLDGYDGIPREEDVLGPSPGTDALSTWARLLRTGVVVDVELPALLVRDLDASARAAALVEATALVAEDPAGAERRWRRRRSTTVVVVGRGAASTGLVRLLERTGVAVATGPDGERHPRPDVTVLSYDHEPPTDAVERLMRDGLLHLVAGMRGVAGHVGPFVRPGSTPCLRCVDLTRSHTEHGWSALREQLSYPPSRRAGTAASPAAGPVTTATVAFTAAEVLAVVDGRTPATAEATAVFRPGDPLPALRTWPAHPLCGCTWQT